MAKNNVDLKEMLRNKEFPLSAKYDPNWVVENQMGPNALWLTEWLCRDMELKPAMRVLDMGCGKVLSSVFLAREFGVQVWANDLWIKPTENWRRICKAGLEKQIFPIKAEARSLPYAEEFFDAIICVDSYFYYGTDDLYLDYFLKFVRIGGQLGIAMPGLMRDFDGPLPTHLTSFWDQECWGWHTAEWWRNSWGRTGLVDVLICEAMREGWKMYLQWKKVLDAIGANRCPGEDIKALDADSGRYIGFIRMIAKRSQTQE